MEKQKSCWSPILIALLMAIANFVSCYLLLDKRPLHHDEAVLGFHFVNKVLAGTYQYDPTNYHGPLYYYIVALTVKLWGWDVSVLRMPIAICKGLTALLPLLLIPFISRSAVFLFGLLLLTSPFYIFFGGSFSIMDSFLGFFILLTCFGCWRMALKPSVLSLASILLGVVGMILTKETYSIFLFAVFMTLCVTFYIRRTLFHDILKFCKANNFLILSMFILSFFIIFIAYTTGFRNLNGFIDIFRAQLSWGNTGFETSGHFKPAWYFLSLFVIYEIPLLFTLILSVRWTRYAANAAFFGAIAFIQLIIYSLIPYKTPWCMISLIAPFLLIPIQNLGALKLPKKAAYLLIISSISLVVSLYYYHQFYTNSYSHTSPFNYVHSDKDYLFLGKALEDMSTLAPLIHTSGLVWIEQSYWPLPYYLRNFKHIHYASENDTFKNHELRKFQLLFLSHDRSKAFLDSIKYTESLSKMDTQTPPPLYTKLVYDHLINQHIHLLIRSDVWLFVPDAIKEKLEVFSHQM